MKVASSMDNLKEVFNAVNLPNIDLRSSVLERINTKKVKVHSMSAKKKLILTIALALSFFCMVGFAARQVLNLTGVSGNSYTYMITSDEDRLTNEVFLEEMKKLKEGQTSVVMKVSNNPENSSFHLYAKPIPVDSVDELTSKNIVKEAFPAYIPEGYSFKEGSLEYNFRKITHEDMLNGSISSDKEVMVKIFEPTTDISGYTCLYSMNETLIDINVSWYAHESDFIGLNDLGQNIEKIKVKDFDAVYSKSDGDYRIEWLDSNDTLSVRYSVRLLSSDKASGDDIKSELIKIAESI
jgi:hypothetical protein